MANQLKRHRILGKISRNHSEKSLEMTMWTDVGMGLSVQQLHDFFGYRMNSIRILCDAMLEDGYFTTNGKFAPHERIYMITAKGKAAHLDKTELNKIWFRQRTILLPAFAIIVPICALGYTIYQKSNTDAQLEFTKGRLIQIEKRLQELSRSN